MTSETIFALSSGAPPNAVAIVRVSGPAAMTAVATLTGRPVPTPRCLALRTFRGPDSSVIDTGLVAVWRGPASFTGEDVAEFQLHGGRAVVARLLAELARIPGCRPAVAGEFTRQAFLNGRMDLTAVEGLGDLIGAETEAQRRAALVQLEGGLRGHCEVLRRQLTEARAHIEAAIDFADESDVPTEVAAEGLALAATVRRTIAELLAAARPAERVRDGVVVVLAGAPNAGKSSLLNALADRDVAIVSDEAGTTRDAIEVDLDLDGHAVRLIDTAGLRDAVGAVEAEGVRRARRRAAAADLVIRLVAADAPVVPEIATTAALWTVLSKGDLVAPAGRAEAVAAQIGATAVISTRRAGGLDGLLDALRRFVAATAREGGGGLVLQLRQRTLLMACAVAVEKALDDALPLELVAEELRRAERELGGIDGATSTEAMLGEIFARFCIGK
jgi:tRNA modification GTPase